MGSNIKNITIDFGDVSGLGSLLWQDTEELKRQISLSARFHHESDPNGEKRYDLMIIFAGRKPRIIFSVLPEDALKQDGNAEELMDTEVILSKAFHKLWIDYLDASSTYYRATSVRKAEELEELKGGMHNELAKKLVRFLAHKGLIIDHSDPDYDMPGVVSRRLIALTLEYASVFDVEARMAVSPPKLGQLPNYIR